jgi:hypothetical protein
MTYNQMAWKKLNLICRADMTYNQMDLEETEPNRSLDIKVLI